MKRAVGISSAKQKFARKTGIPTTRSGMQRKAGRAMGCLIPMISLLITFILLVTSTAAFALSFDSDDVIEYIQKEYQSALYYPNVSYDEGISTYIVNIYMGLERYTNAVSAGSDGDKKAAWAIELASLVNRAEKVKGELGNKGVIGDVIISYLAEDPSIYGVKQSPGIPLLVIKNGVVLFDLADALATAKEP